MQTIITPTDFSEISVNAISYASDMAMALNANLLVLHAIELPININKFYDESGTVEVEAERKLNNLKEDLTKRTNGKICVQTKQVIGLIENEIIKVCSQQNTLAVVTATKGAFKVQFFMGSITAYLSRNLKYPMIVVPPQMHYKPVHKLLLATDLENIYSLPVDGIVKITTAFNARLDILHIFNDEKFEIVSERMVELRNYLDILKPHVYRVYNKNVYDGITEFAREHNSDIILTFPRKHQFLHESESEHLLFNAPFTVMTIQ